MGKMYYSCAIFPLIMILLTMEFAICSSFSNNTTSFSCVAREKKALLKLKASFTDPSNRLSSWNDTTESDCCAWQGVTCDKITRHVISLYLGNPDPFVSFDTRLASNQLDSSLSELKYLNHLDVSGNDFQKSPIPAFLGSVKQLQHLNLSFADFSGVVPHHLGNLSSLRVLDLRDGYSLMVDDLKWASNLSRLEHLDLSSVDLSRTKHLSEVIFNMLPSILVLRLRGTQLNNTHLPHACVNSSPLTNIQHLDLSHNSFDGEFPCFLHNMTSLRVLDLADNQYNPSSLHALLRFRNLVYLDLSVNSLLHKADWISEFLSDKCNLKSLDLAYNNFYGDISGVFKNLSTGCWTHKLEELYLSENKFYGDLPKEFGELKQLNYLSLSRNAFTGPIPTSLGKLKQLNYLDLSDNTFTSPIPTSLGKLKQLNFLSLSSNAFTGPIPTSLGKLKQLNYLDLSDNTFTSPIPTSLGKLKQLNFLSLSSNSFTGPIPTSLGKLKQLNYLDLSDNTFTSPIPTSLGKLKQLNFLSLSSNAFTGPIPTSLGKLKQLNYLDLSDNTFTSPIPTSLGKLKQLNFLSLSSNSFTGPIPTSLGKLKQLNYLDLSSNAFTGPIPTSLGKLRDLRYLYLSDNKLSGPIPTSLWQLSNLEGISLSNNPLNSTLSEGHFAKLSKLEQLDVSSIDFSVNFDWVPPFQLKYLQIDSSNIGGQFPQWLQTQKGLHQLSLSNCSISGTLPIKWFHSMKNLTQLDLSHNHIKGPISDPLCQLKGLEILDLSKNHFSGNLPDCLATLQLFLLKLSFNKLSGVIPNSMGESGSLYSLMLSSNRLQGQLPSTLKNCGFLETLDVEENMLSGDLPDWIGTHLNSLKFLRLGKNEFRGVIPSTFCRLSNLQVMDLANNKLAGHIPHCFDNLLGMVKDTNSSSMSFGLSISLIQVIKGVEMEYTKTLQYLVNLDLSSNDLDGEIPQQLTSLSGLIGLNLSHNRLAGKIPRNIGDMNSLTSLDLSNNKLCGSIPNSLSDLNFLEFLNLSHNNLSGKIPTGNQLQTLNESSIYQGNPGLCGDSLLKKCFEDEAPKSPNAEDQGEKVEKIIFYGVIVSGFATGFWGIIGVLVLKTSWRHAFFQFAEAMIRKMLGL